MSSRGARRRSSDALAMLRLRPSGPLPEDSDRSPPVATPPDATEAVLRGTGDDSPARLRLLTLDRPAVAGLVLLAVFAVTVAGARLWWASPEVRPVHARRAVIETPAGGEAGRAQATAGVVFVHVAGAVLRPGVVELPAGSRVADAVAGAGGLRRRADPASVNLARLLVDGEQIVVLRLGSPEAAVGGSTAATPSAGTPGQVRLNTATVQELDSLPGIGPVLAQRIVDWRTAHQRFTSVEELGEVSGIGEATLADLRPLVTL